MVQLGQVRISASEGESSESSTPYRFSWSRDCAKLFSFGMFALLEVITKFEQRSLCRIRWSASC